MDSNDRLSSSIAILGAGPIGLEAALYARALGLDAIVYEAGEVGEHLLRWGQVRLFTPWKLNTTSLGRQALKDEGLGDEVVCPTGSQMVERYLLPLARSEWLRGRVNLGTKILGITRETLFKGQEIGKKSRRSSPFRLLLQRTNGKEELAHAHWVLDCTGVHGQPGPAGAGGLPAPGEREAEAMGRVRYGLSDLLGTHREEVSGKRLLLVGGGFSAATLARDLAVLHGENPDTLTLWLLPERAALGVHSPDGDVLPERRALAGFTERALRGEVPGVLPLMGARIQTIQIEGAGLRVAFSQGEDSLETAPLREETVDLMQVATGFRPDSSLHRELQVHQCYASEGPMKLAAALLAGDSTDCLTIPESGPQTLTSPEPGFFLLGNKSYGRTPTFLLRTGHIQVRDVFRLLTEDPLLDLYSH